MKIHYFSIMFSVFLFFALQYNAIAQDKQSETTSLSLKQAQDYAIKNSATSRNSSIDMELAQKKIWETKAMGLPQVSAQANYQHLFVVPQLGFPKTVLSNQYLEYNAATNTGTISQLKLGTGENIYMNSEAGVPLPLGVPNNTSVNFTVSQLIFSGEYIVGLQATKVFYELTDQTRQKTESDIRESVANTYAMALSFEQTRDILDKTLLNTNKTFSDMQAMFKQGLIENTDVDQIELITLNLKNGLSSMNRQLDATYDLLKFQLGMPFGDKIILTDNLDEIANTVNLETLIAAPFNIKNNIDYQLLNTSELVGNLNLKREKSTYLPNLAAAYVHTYLVNQPAFNFTPKDVFQISMNVPIFSSGSRHVKVQQRQLELQKIINTKNDAANGLQLQYITAKNELTSAYEKYLNDKRNIDLTKRIYDKTLIKFNEGIASSREITDNLAQFLTAQSNMYTSIISLISSKNKLDKLNNNL